MKLVTEARKAELGRFNEDLRRLCDRYQVDLETDDDDVLEVNDRTLENGAFVAIIDLSAGEGPVIKFAKVADPAAAPAIDPLDPEPKTGGKAKK